MEILKDIKSVNLRSFISPIQHEIQCPFISKSFCTFIHFIDNGQNIRREHIQTKLKSTLSEDPSKAGLVVIFDILDVWIESNDKFNTFMSTLTTQQRDRLLIINSIDTPSHLVRLIRSLRDPTSSLYKNFPENVSKLPISLILVDNISAFYWTAKKEGTITQDYTSIGSVLRNSKDQMGCSIITTSWDKGYNVKTTSASDYGSSVYQHTDIPSVYFQFVDHMYSFRARGVRKDNVVCKYLTVETKDEQEFNIRRSI